MGKKYFYVYILSSISGTLYVGVTDNLSRRMLEHKNGRYDSFTKEHEVNRLMYFETYTDQKAAELREQQVKKYRRAKKIALFEPKNSQWRDLTEELLVLL
jgi:putative endonuclease